MAKLNLSWMGIFKFVPIAVGLLSGSLGIAQQLVLLYSENPAPFWQEKVFWRFVWIALILSFGIAWFQEHWKVRKLRQQIEDTQPKLDFELTDIFLVHPSGFEDLISKFITVEIRATNPKPQANTITKCRLLLEAYLISIKSDLNSPIPQKDLGQACVSAILARYLSYSIAFVKGSWRNLCFAMIKIC